MNTIVNFIGLGCLVWLGLSLVCALIFIGIARRAPYAPRATNRRDIWN